MKLPGEEERMRKDNTTLFFGEVQKFRQPWIWGRDGGICIRFFHFHLSFCRIPLEKLKKYEVRKYSPIKEYGGWRIRYGRIMLSSILTGVREEKLKVERFRVVIE